MKPKVHTQENIYYWSYWIGHYKSKKTEWILHDRKMPARDAKEAIILFEFHTSYYYKQKISKSKYTPFPIPTSAQVWCWHRRLIQYERIYSPQRGFTVHQYKKVAEHSVYTFIDLFK